MTQHQFSSADLANDIILYPTSDELRKSPDDPILLAKARRAVKLYFDLLQAILAQAIRSNSISSSAKLP